MRLEKGLESGGKLTQKMAAKAIGVSDRQHQTLEAGSMPNGTTLYRIGKHFGCNLYWLLYGEGEKYPKAPEPEELSFFPDSSEAPNSGPEGGEF